MARMILVVDDDPIVLNVTSDMLADIGCETVTALSGPEALDRLSQGPRIEILISDINMPGMDGYELVRQAKHMRGDLRVEPARAASPILLARPFHSAKGTVTDCLSSGSRPPNSWRP